MGGTDEGKKEFDQKKLPWGSFDAEGKRRWKELMGGEEFEQGKDKGKAAEKGTAGGVYNWHKLLYGTGEGRDAVQAIRGQHTDGENELKYCGCLMCWTGALRFVTKGLDQLDKMEVAGNLAKFEKVAFTSKTESGKFSGLEQRAPKILVVSELLEARSLTYSHVSKDGEGKLKYEQCCFCENSNDVGCLCGVEKYVQLGLPV